MRRALLGAAPAARRTALGVGLLMTLLAVRWVDGSGPAVDAVSVPDTTSRRSASAAAVPAPEPTTQPANTETPGRREPAAEERGSPAAPARALTIPVERLERARALPRGEADPFAQATWTPAAIAAAETAARVKREAATPPPPPPPPMAPPLPFTFFGRLIDGERQQVFLNQGQNTVIATVGETIDNQYRVDRLDDDAVHFTYLPLGQQQVLAIPGTTK
jgi:hypothetical protein